jgi:hypothetical protein
MFERRQQVIGLAKAHGAPHRVAMPRPKRLIGIEALLRWAYSEELPKVSAGGALSFLPAGFVTASFAAEAGENVRVNRFGVVPDFSAPCGPHADALAIAGVVKSLDEFELAIPDGWDPFADLGEMGGHRAAAIADVLARLTVIGLDGRRRLKTKPSRLIMRHAILGGCPDWRAEKPEVKFVCAANGKPRWYVRQTVLDVSGIPFEVEADGYSKSAKRPVAGAYRKTYLDPDPVEAGVKRGEYEIWRAALDLLVGVLDGQLEANQALPCARPQRPWEGSYSPPRVLPVVPVYRGETALLACVVETA